MNLVSIANLNESTPPATVALEPQDQLSSNDVKLFAVRIAADVHLRLSGRVKVYATNADEAAQNVQGQIDDEMLHDDLELEDWNGAITLGYGDLKYCDEIYLQTDEVEVVEEYVDPADVLRAEVEGLERQIAWNSELLGKRKAFLESLGNEQTAAA
jgi:hypothetical protein